MRALGELDVEMMSFKHVLENLILTEKKRLFHHCRVRVDGHHAEQLEEGDICSSAARLLRYAFFKHCYCKFNCLYLYSQHISCLEI